MAPKTRRSLRKADDKQLLEMKKRKPTSLRAQLSVMTVPVLKDILRHNHQNPFGNKPDLLSRIVYMEKHGVYPRCPKCIEGRVKSRVHRRKTQSKYYCAGYPTSFRSPSSYHYCDYKTDECKKEPFRFPPALDLNNK